MARITVEDCLDHVANRFELVMVATKRARDLSLGTKDPMVPWENDKPTVVALREIALGYIDRTYLDGKQDVDDEQGGEQGGGGSSQLGNIDFSMPL